MRHGRLILSPIQEDVADRVVAGRPWAIFMVWLLLPHDEKDAV